MRDAHWDVFFFEDVSDSVIEAVRDVWDLEVCPFRVGRLRVSLVVLWTF